MDDLARRWWDGELGVGGRALDVLLAPAEALYRVATSAREAAYDRGVLHSHRAAIRVISVGNVAVGGTGKTPFAAWLARRLADQGRRPAILHGGYAADEPELHRRWSPDIPVLVGRDRVASAAAAAAAGADVVVLDDGFQHRRLQRDLDVVLVAAERWGGHARMLPRGPWREPASALARADVVVVTRKLASPERRDAVLSEVARPGLTTAAVQLLPAGWRSGNAGTAGTGPEGPAVLVSGVAEPALLAANARAAGAELAEHLAFRDHHEYAAADARRIVATAGGRDILTTEKDWTKLARWLAGARVWLLQQAVVVEHGAAELDRHIARALS